MKMGDINNDYLPIQDYGIIGDFHTIALVSRMGSIDFLCLEKFDSPTVFAKLLDSKKGGHFQIKPVLDHIDYKQIYLPDTAILLTRFFAEDGIAELTDFMPVGIEKYSFKLIRRIKTIRGNIKFRLHIDPKFNYATEKHSVKMVPNGIIFKWKNNFLELHSNIKIERIGSDGVAEFFLKESESADFVLSYRNSKSEKVILGDVDIQYAKTVKYWNSWIRKSNYSGRWREMVNRSLITLKLMISKETGAPIAAPTFGLPEIVGGTKNWDYRYSWIRDSAFTMYVFLKLGYMEEARTFMSWVTERFYEGRLRIMYSGDGNKNLDEYYLGNFEGYKGSRPVRIGNKAHKQTQIDIYGELIDTVYLFNKDGGAITYNFWLKIVESIEYLIRNWRKPDNGIWETRGKRKRFLYSRMMCWVAIDRAIKIAENRSFGYPVVRWRNERSKIFNDIFFNFWNEEKKTFVESLDSDSIDGSVLLMSLKRLLSPYEEKWKYTMNAVAAELMTDVLVFRNNDDQGSPEEGTFTMCSFWFAECLAKSGKTQQAREHFAKILGYANHLGLFSEEIGIKGEHLGNFPQAFTHLALVSAAIELDKDLV